MQVEHPDSSIVTYSYNADGPRVEEDHDGVIKRLVYDGNNVQFETDDVGDLLVDNTYVPGEYAKALSQRRDGDSNFYLADGTKNIRQLTEYKGQELAYRADPDAGPELQYALHFRQYDPHTARFTSRDPAEDDLNLYRYVKNNPVNGVDPSGLDETSDALNVVDKLLTGGVITLKFFGGIAYGVFVNELWGTVKGAAESAKDLTTNAAKTATYVAYSVYGYYSGDVDATRAAEDMAIEKLTTVDRAGQFFKKAGPTLAAIFSDITPNGMLDGPEPETIAFIQEIAPELQEIQDILVAKIKNAPAEDIAWKLGEIVGAILMGLATMGVGMAAQGGKLTAMLAKLKKTLSKWGLDREAAQRIADLVNKMLDNLEHVIPGRAGKRSAKGETTPDVPDQTSPTADKTPELGDESPAQAPKPENGNGSLDETDSSQTISANDELAPPDVVNAPKGITNTKQLQFADRAWFDDIDAYRALKADIKQNGLKKNLIQYVEIDGQKYVVRGNGRLQVAEDLGITDQLVFEKVDLPFPPGGNGYRNAADVIEEALNIIYNRPRGNQ